MHTYIHTVTNTCSANSTYLCQAASLHWHVTTVSSVVNCTENDSLFDNVHYCRTPSWKRCTNLFALFIHTYIVGYHTY